MRVSLFLLCFAQAGDALSVDNLLASLKQDWRKVGFEPRLSAPWGQRMIQVQMALAYCSTFFGKISGEQWINGTAVYIASRLGDFSKFQVPFVFDNIATLKLLNYFALAAEGSLWTLIWFKETRYWVLLLGVLLHLGIDWSMVIPVFEYLFIAAYILFVEPDDLRKVMDAIKSRLSNIYGAPALLAYDGRCLDCVCVAGTMHRLDIFGRFKLTDINDLAETIKSNHTLAVKQQDTWLTGFAAFRALVTRAPLFWQLCLCSIYLAWLSFLPSSMIY